MRYFEKFNSLDAFNKFWILFIGIFAISLPAIPVAMLIGRRILSEQLSDIQFIVVGTIICGLFACFLAGTGVIGEKIINNLRKYKTNKTLKHDG